MKFGDCLKLSDLVASQFGPGTWDADTGIFTVTLSATGTCPGGGGGSGEPGSTLLLAVGACGKLRITASGTGYLYAEGSVSLIVYGGSTGDVVVSLEAPGGGDPSDACATGPLVGTPGGDMLVDCGDGITIALSRSTPDNIGEITATVTLEVVE